MKVAHAEKHVLGTGGLGETQAFKIRTSAHAFKILSSGLYSDKISAVLREIGCNAHDAHIAAGISHQPFEVKLPNSLDNQFYIRDHGIGLSHEDVMNLYTTYFASTKQESNDFTGAFGLGSKSPFSYTDSFTITACHGGKKRIYTAHIGDHGEPIVAIMTESDAPEDWKTGIEVGFPVKAEDFRSFAEKATKIFRFFDPLPTITGTSLSIKPLHIERDFGSYAFLDKNDNDFSGIAIKMGNVRYPLDVSSLTLDRDNVSRKATELSGLLLRFNLGEIQVAASRESIQYDPVTQRAIIVRLKAVLLNIIDELVKAHSTANTWAKICAFKDLRDVVSRGLHLGKELFELAGISDKKLIEACSSMYYKLPVIDADAKAYFCLLTEISTNAGSRMRVMRGSGIGSTGWIGYHDNVTIVEGMAKQALGRMRKALLIDNTLTGQVIAVLPKKSKGGEQIDVDAALRIVCEAFPGVPVKSLEDYEAPIIPTKKRGGLGTLPSEDVVVNGNVVKLSDVTDKIYVPIKRLTAWGRRRVKWIAKEDGSELPAHHVESIVSHMGTLNKALASCNICHPVQITRGDAKRHKMAKRADWMSFVEHVRQQLLNPDVVKELKAIIGKARHTIDLEYRSWTNPHGLCTCLVLLKEHKIEAYATLTKVLKDHDIFSAVERVHRDSKNPSSMNTHTSEPLVLSAYKLLAMTLGIEIDVPDFHKVTMNLDDKFKRASEVNYSTLCTVWELAPDNFPDFMNALLKRG